MATRTRLSLLRRAPIISVWTRNRRAGPDFAAAQPPPPPPPWPPTKVRATVLWNAPMEPPPPWEIREFYNLDPIPGTELYTGLSTGFPDYVDCTFALDPVTGWYDFQIIGKRADDLVALATVPPNFVIPGEPFILGLWTWIGLPPLHGLTVTLYHPYQQ